jgi:hypothetical protein
MDAFVLYLRILPSRAEQMDRCRREVEACRKAGVDQNLTPAERLGAIQGEVDWLVALQMAEEG